MIIAHYSGICNGFQHIPYKSRTQRRSSLKEAAISGVQCCSLGALCKNLRREMEPGTARYSTLFRNLQWISA